MLLIFRPFRIGNSVTIGGNSGSVKALSLLWTEVVTDANVQVIIPNGIVWGQPIKNMSTAAAPAGMALDEAQRRIVAIVKATPKVLPSPAPMLLQN